MNINVFDQSQATDVLIFWQPIEKTTVTDTVDITRSQGRDISVSESSIVTDTPIYWDDTVFISERLTVGLIEEPVLTDIAIATDILTQIEIIDSINVLDTYTIKIGRASCRERV